MTGIVVVNYRTARQTVNFAESELSKLPSPFRMVVVDVGNDAESAELPEAGLNAVRITDPESSFVPDGNVFLISTAENLGYARGNNLGAKFLLDHFPDVSHLLFSNNDIEIIDPDVVDELASVFSLADDIGAAGPHVEGRFGRQGPAWERKSIRREILLKLFYPLTWPLFRRMHKAGKRPAPCRYCYSVIGCFFMVSRRAFELCGGFDPATFLYGEEDILAERLRRCGFRYYFLGNRRVAHREGEVTRKFLAASRSDRLRLESHVYYYRTYRESSEFELALYRFSNRLFSRFTEPLVCRTRQMLDRLFRRGDRK